MPYKPLDGFFVNTNGNNERTYNNLTCKEPF